MPLHLVWPLCHQPYMHYISPLTCSTISALVLQLCLSLSCCTVVLPSLWAQLEGGDDKKARQQLGRQMLGTCNTTAKALLRSAHVVVSAACAGCCMCVVVPERH
jgi:hypothetical protein